MLSRYVRICRCHRHLPATGGPWPLPLVVLALLLAASAVPAAQAAEVLHVRNAAEPADGVRTAQLEELWRIGGEDDEENLLGVIDKALVDDQGNVYLLDIQLMEVMVFSPEGQYLRSLGQRGSGPGEIERASGLVFLPDGTVGLVQAFPGKIVKVDRDGVPAGELRPGGDDPSTGGFFALRGSQAAGGHLVLSGARMSRDEDRMTARHFIATFDGDGREQRVLYGKTIERERGFGRFVEKDDFFPHGAWALAADGRVAIARQRNAYRLHCYGPDGALERIIERPYESWRRTDAERERAVERVVPFRRRNPRSIDVVVEPTERDILSLHYAPDGRLWVLPSRGIRRQPAGVHSTWDVFDADGRFVEQISLACAGDGQRDTVLFPGGDLVLLVKEHDDAMDAFRGRGNNEADAADTDARSLEVVCYRMKE